MRRRLGTTRLLLPCLLVAVLLQPVPGNAAASSAPEAATAAAARLPTIRSTGRVATGVVLVGRTRIRNARLVVQRKAGSRWVRVRRTRGHGRRYRVVVPHRTRSTRYRVRNRATGAHSRRIRVAPARDACGVRPLDGRRLWSCRLVDHFTGRTLDRSTWLPQDHGYWTGTDDARACYREENVSVSGGSLRLVLRAQPLACPGLQGLLTPYTAGMVTTYHRFSQRYGRFAARVRNTATDRRGLHEAFWLWPDNRYVDVHWPYTGEIDVSETYSRYPHLTIPFLHYSNDANGQVLTGKHANTAYCRADRGRWHTYRLVWRPRSIRIYVDNRLCLTNTSGDRAFRERYIVAFTQAVGAPGNVLNPLHPPPLPAAYQVDWVKVWQ